MIKKLIYFSILFLLIADLSYSFMQHLGKPLDGDISLNLVPANDVKPIFESPLGFKAVKENITYVNPNRFFSHWIYREYLLNTPILLQKLVDPIDSIYLACALFKIIVQFMLIVMLAILITGSIKIFKQDFMTAAILVTPLFQTNGYRSYMGIIDPAITYVFFYAFPCVIILLYFIPFILRYYQEKKSAINLFCKITWIPFSFVVCLSGPLNPGIVLIFSVLVIITRIIKNLNSYKKERLIKRIYKATSMIPFDYWICLLPVILLSIYSLFIGRYNSFQIEKQIPLGKMYLQLPEGIYYLLTQKLGFFILLVMLAINTVIIYFKYKNPEGKKILNIFKWIGIFALCYIILLPLGGYRIYRPYILRYDTIMPITLSLFFIFGSTSLFLLKNISQKQKLWYLPLLIGILLIFTIADEPEFDKNRCERAALKEIKESKESVIGLKNDCSVISWTKTDKSDKSELNAQLLNLWRVTNKKKYYYNE